MPLISMWYIVFKFAIIECKVWNYDIINVIQPQVIDLVTSKIPLPHFISYNPSDSISLP